ncbi:hypothetical protein SAMN04487941_3063 [Pontibacter akesuensis]|uniref:Uncharacterized protein n=1 Tax=Pontibacter akesuensis TaxID=388950 RepID=A0A1I7JNJ1_9BACT|nr:hypothetical protein SAMN04487941_3063 [Pontibacter akesuensis]
MNIGIYTLFEHHITVLHRLILIYLKASAATQIELLAFRESYGML